MIIGNSWLWGIEIHVIERFGSAGVTKENILFEKDTFTFIAPFSPLEVVGSFNSYYDPTMNAFEAAEKSGKEVELQQRELEDLFNCQNKSNSPDTTSIPASYLRVTVLG